MQVLKLMNTKGIRLEGAKILVMGLTFKENCPDLRNTKVADLIKEFKDAPSIPNLGGIVDNDKITFSFILLPNIFINS